MRDPGIHITKSQLEEILSLLEIDNFPTEAFLTLARKKSTYSRAVFYANKKEDKEIQTTLLASTGDAELAADIFYMCRIKLHHIGVKKINQSDITNWDWCKKLADNCNSFCQSFGLPTREGFIKYMEIGISRVEGSTRGLLPRLVKMYENICVQYDNELQIAKYRNNQQVLDICDYYTRLITSSTGIYEDYKSDPLKYIHFVRCYEFLESKGIPYQAWLNAQFEALAFCNGIPRLEDLYNDKAIERYNKFKYKAQAISDEPQIEGSLWDKIK